MERRVPYIALDIQLNNWVSDPRKLTQEIQQRLFEKLEPKSHSDIEVEISESAGWDEGKRFTFIVSHADIPNKNNRIYPAELLKKLVDDFKKSNKKPIFGQMGMPMNSIIREKEKSHVVDDLKLSPQNELFVDILVLDTPRGKELLKLIEGDKVAFRLQGEGEVHSEGENYIVDNFRLIAINAVSAEDAA